MQAARPSPVSPHQGPPRVRWLILSLACAASWLLYLHRYSWGVLKPAFRREHPDLTDTEVGWLDAAFNAAYALGQIPGGLAGDAFGPRAILTALILLWSLAATGVAWASGFWGLFGARASFGLAQAGAYPVLSKGTRTWFPLSVRTSVQGLVTALGRVGAACSSLLLATLLMGLLGMSWQAALWVLAAPGVAVAVAFWVATRDGPREHPWTDPAGRGSLGAGPPPPVAGPGPALRWSGASLVTLGMLLLYSFASTFQDQLYVFWIPSFLVEGRGLDMEEMGLYTTLPLLGGAVGAILGGVLNDALLRATGHRRWARSGVGFTGKFLAAILVLVSVHVADGRLAMVVLFAARVFGDWGLATLWGAITDTAGRASGTVFGLVNAFGALGGFLAGPALGSLKQHHGWEGLFLGVALLCLLSAFCWLFIDCTRRLAAD
jgi:sugar phosphate permease